MDSYFYDHTIVETQIGIGERRDEIYSIPFFMTLPQLDFM